MSYFDPDTSSYFETDQHGRKLFFPWGLWGRVYVVSSEQDHHRLERELKAFMIVSKLYSALLTVQTIAILLIVAHFVDAQNLFFPIFVAVWIAIFTLRIVHYMVLGSVPT